MIVPFSDFQDKKEKIAVVGLGYVGLPLALSLAQYFSVIGFDVNTARIADLSTGFDKTGEVTPADFNGADITFTATPAELSKARVIIVAVPTPVTSEKIPDLSLLRKASLTVGKHMSKGSVVVYESTVYPGATEEECLPLLEQYSGLTAEKDFYLGYSPERINPGDKVHTVDKIIKVVSATSVQVLELLAAIYGTVVTAGIHKVSSIKVAEAAKVIENTQRDLNIALMNEFALIFDTLGIDTSEVLAAAGTKWNFLPFQPGIVGGHCIGVDPYYLTYKAEQVGYRPRVILAGRQINDEMGTFIAEKTASLLTTQGVSLQEARVGIFGLTFKENVADIRNSKVIDIYTQLRKKGVCVLVHDPWVEGKDSMGEYGFAPVSFEELTNLDACIFAVNHDVFKKRSWADFMPCLTTKHTPVVVDVKGLWLKKEQVLEECVYWRL